MPRPADTTGASLPPPWVPLTCLYEGTAQGLVLVGEGEDPQVHLNAAARAALGAHPQVAFHEALARVLQGGGSVTRVPLGRGAGHLHLLPGAVAGSQGVLQQVLGGSRDVVLAVSDEGVVLYANGAARGLIAVGIEPVGCRTEDFLPPGARVALHGGRPPLSACLTPAGPRWLVWTVTPLGGGLMLLTGRDMSTEVQAVEALNHRVARLEAVSRVARAVARGDDHQNLMALVLRLLSEITPAHGAWIGFLGHQVLEPALAFWRGAVVVPDRGAGPVPDAVGRQVLRSQGCLVQATPPHPTDHPGLPAEALVGATGALVVPLVARERVFGTVNLVTCSEGGFTEDDADAAREVADQLAASVVTRRLTDALARHARDLDERVDERTRQLAETRRQLDQADRLSSLGKLAAGTAHELAQPLQVVTAWADTLRVRQNDPIEVDRLARQIGQAAQRMCRLVDHLRSFGRAGAELLVPFDLREAVDMARELSRHAVRPPLEIVWRRPDQELPVTGDPQRVEQVLINLLSNAQQATVAAGGQRVVVSAGLLGGGAVCVEVRDQGGGVPPELRQRIFEPFYTTRAGQEGTGLGLSISAKIVQEHGGRIEVGDAEGGGAVFRLVLPRAT